MYVCICNALNEKKVNQALDNGASTPAGIFRHHEAQVQCGKCVPMMRDMAKSRCAGLCSNRAANQPVPSEVEYGYAIAAE